MLPVVGSTTRARTRCPPSFRSQTPCRGVAAIHVFQRLTHFCLLIIYASFGRRRTQTIHGDLTRRRATQESVQFGELPHPRSAAAAASGGGDAAFGVGFAERAGGF